MRGILRSLRKSKVIIILIFLVFAVIFFLIFQKNGGSEQKYTLRIGDAQQPAFSLLYLAEKLGYIEEQGVKITYKKYTSGRDALNGVIKGDVDLATVFETPVVIQSMKGENLKVFTELHQTSKNNQIIALKNKGISVGSDLRGKRIAVPRGSGAEFIAHVILNEFGIGSQEVIWVDTKPEDMPKVLQSGDVDAIVVWNPHAFNAKSVVGSDEVEIFYSSQIKELSVLAGKDSSILKKGEAIQRLIQALYQAQEYLNAHPEESFDMMKDYFSGLDQQLFGYMWQTMNLNVGFSAILPIILDQEAIWFSENTDAVLKNDVLDDLLHYEYVEAIDPLLVNILH